MLPSVLNPKAAHDLPVEQRIARFVTRNADQHLPGYLGNIKVGTLLPIDPRTGQLQKTNLSAQFISKMQVRQHNWEHSSWNGPLSEDVMLIDLKKTYQEQVQKTT